MVAKCYENEQKKRLMEINYSGYAIILTNNIHRTTNHILPHVPLRGVIEGDGLSQINSGQVNFITPYYGKLPLARA